MSSYAVKTGEQTPGVVHAYNDYAYLSFHITAQSYIIFFNFAVDYTGMGYLLTIIIPNRNILDLLERCLSSLPRRDDIQIIVVDDASDISEEERMSYPGVGDPHVNVIFTKEARGAGYARNVALEHAEGKWLMFVDSDDFLLEGALDLIDRYMGSDSDIVFFGIESRYSDTLEPAWRGEKFEEAFSRYSERDGQLEKFLRYGYTEPWGKLIRRSLVIDNAIRFDESLVANDYMFSVKTGYHASSVEFCREPLVCITVRSGSLCNDYFGSDEKTMSRLEVYAGVQRFFDVHGIAQEPLFRFLRGIRGKKKHLFAVALDKCASLGFSRLHVLWRCFMGYVGKFFKPENKFC